MRWFRLFGRDDRTGPQVTDIQRDEVHRARESAADRRRDVASEQPEISRLARYFQRESSRNHLAERMRQALGG
jgi:hypothetical protein